MPREGLSVQGVWYLLDQLDVGGLETVVSFFRDDEVDACNQVLREMGQSPLSGYEFERIQLEIDQRMNRPSTPEVV